MARFSATMLVLVLPLIGCAVGPAFRPPQPEVPKTWNAAPAVSVTTDMADLTAWWVAFRDPELDSLIVRAAQANLDLKAATLRIAEARQQRDVARAGLLPGVNVNASETTTRLSETTPTGALFSQVGRAPGLSGLSIPNPYEQYQLGFDASWELDLFGRVRRSVEAASATEAAQVEDSRAVRISVLGEVGRVYVDLRGAQARRALTAETIADLRERLELAAQRRQAGLASEIDVARAASQASSATAQLPPLDRQITDDIDTLSQLLALQPGALKAELSVAQPVPPVPPAAPIGLPADLARRRPDIREAEARLHAATAQVGVAVADLFPRLTLQGQGGLQSETLSSLTHWASRFLTAGPSVELPIFDAGRRRATVRLYGVRETEAALDYRKAVLAAFHDVDHALAAYGADQSRKAALEGTLAHDRDAVDLARQRYASGVGSYIDVLDAERTRLQNQLALAESTAAVSTDLIALYKALGGGWS